MMHTSEAICLELSNNFPSGAMLDIEASIQVSENYESTVCSINKFWKVDTVLLLWNWLWI